MSYLLQRLFGRLPIGWLQLTHNRTRFAAALAGVAFANVLVFVQLGIMNSMGAATLRPYEFFHADIMISAGDASTLTDGGNVARQWLLQALGDPDVAAGMGLFIANVPWDRGEKDISLTTFGVDPIKTEFLSQDIAGDLNLLQVRDAAILDRLARGLAKDEAASIRPQTPLSFETQGRTITAYATFSGGGGFGGDGYMLVSDQTFLSLFPTRSSSAPDHILLSLRSSAQTDVVIARLKTLISDPSLRIRSYKDAAQEDLRYQQTKRPTGIIFGFGVLIGVLVGIVIVYQVLSTDVADHLREYATFKAMGYGPRFFLGIVFEEALVLGIMGFIPGLIVGTTILTLMGKITTLPLGMTPSMAMTVFLGTIVFSALSGAIATRRLGAADPADLF
ncbi:MULTISPECIES: FtsX-like permease family protein [Rhizobium]|jgi:putative ABC transport system permease protein|uniref:FtsX-like permease family protein n=1 Tax=Rhizobium TaxID=379 RepID=UPI001411E78F|nr:MULTISPECIES: FtsX-like permease family protein [Rhizobium]MBC2775830.1 FtsX-like permease family protein [Rhizobium sp. AQ_MP]MDR7030843.1 putative ABC transport system permease protein [Rhizobium rosettiformans]MDR7062536.1 putative ABC transport system permease protein [Rhizobium rosettiformans]NBB47085.1 FtsX-like permease family protein [Rhizobium sp. CRIBSB]